MRDLTIGASIVALAIAVTATGAHAAGFALREQSAEGQGASFAGVAAGTDGLSSMFWNPATIVLHDGFMSESNVSLIVPSSRAKNGVSPGVPAAFSNSGDIGVATIIPTSYYTYKVSDVVYLGLGINAPFGLETKNRVNWAGAPHGTKSEIFSFNVNPNIALKITDELAVAVGLQVEYFDAKLKAGLPVTGTQIAKIKGDDIDVGFTAGILFQPADATQIGLGFRSSIDHKLDGKATVGPFFGPISANVETPEIVTFGLRHDFDEKFTFLAGVEWTNWSRLKNLNIVSKATGTTVAFTPENWDDSWFFSLGGEYHIDERWTVRAGVAYEDSGVPTSTRTPRLPDNDRYWISAGASYKVADWITANVAYSHVFMDDGVVNLAAAAPLPALSATYKQHIDIVSASATFNW